MKNLIAFALLSAFLSFPPTTFAVENLASTSYVGPDTGATPDPGVFVMNLLVESAGLLLNLGNSELSCAKLMEAQTALKEAKETDSNFTEFPKLKVALKAAGPIDSFCNHRGGASIEQAKQAAQIVLNTRFLELND